MDKENRNAENLIIRLQTIRECKDITQADLAKITGVKQEVISRMETGKNCPSLKTFCKFANALGYKLVLIKEDTND